MPNPEFNVYIRITTTPPYLGSLWKGFSTPRTLFKGQEPVDKLFNIFNAIQDNSPGVAIQSIQCTFFNETITGLPGSMFFPSAIINRLYVIAPEDVEYVNITTETTAADVHFLADGHL